MILYALKYTNTYYTVSSVKYIDTYYVAHTSDCAVRNMLTVMTLYSMKHSNTVSTLGFYSVKYNDTYDIDLCRLCSLKYNNTYYTSLYSVNDTNTVCTEIY